MSFSAFSLLKPNSFWNTHVTYDIRFTGSFQTMVTHGRSRSGTSSISGDSAGITCGAAMPSIVPRRWVTAHPPADGMSRPRPRRQGHARAHVGKVTPRAYGRGIG